MTPLADELQENNPFIVEECQGLRSWVLPHWKALDIQHGFLEGQLDIRQATARRQFRTAFLTEETPFYLLSQVHGSAIATIPDSTDARPEADAWFASPGDQHACLGIITADCVPVLLLDRSSLRVAAVHCGWRGVAAKLLPKVIEQFLAAGVSAEGIELALGPAAGAASYEIDRQVADLLRQSLPPRGTPDFSGEEILVENRPEHFLCDLRRLLAKQAVSCGISAEQIFLHPACTITNLNFFSFRRQKALSGRQLSYIISRPSP